MSPKLNALLEINASPGFVASATKGYVVDSYPIVYLKIVGLPSLSNMLGVQNNEIEIFGEYSGTSSYVYEIESPQSWRLFHLAEAASRV